METYGYLLLRTHVYLLSIIIVVFAIEVLTGKLILVRWFKYKKDMKSAVGSADREALLYFLFNLGYASYAVYIKQTLTNFNLWIWLLIIIPLTIIFRKLYFKYQGVDPQKKDYEFLS